MRARSSLKGAVGDSPIPANRLTFSVYVPEAQNSEGRLVIADAKANDMIRLPEGTYHVVSTYGDANAIMRSDLKVESGRVTEATLNHRAATVTLKLVASAGGEAFAGTAFSVLTPGGDVIREAIGAFPVGDAGRRRICPDRPPRGQGLHARIQDRERARPRHRDHHHPLKRAEPFSPRGIDRWPMTGRAAHETCSQGVTLLERKLMKIAEIMTRNVRVVGPDRTIQEAARLMDEMNVGSFPSATDDVCAAW